MASPAPVVSLWKVNISGGSTLDFYTSGFDNEINVELSEDGALGDTVSTIFFFASDSDMLQMQGKVYTSANLALLQAAATNFTTITITNEFGGSFLACKIMGLHATRIDALNYGANSWFDVLLELRRIN